MELIDRIYFIRIMVFDNINYIMYDLYYEEKVERYEDMYFILGKWERVS